jgi:hypothetical protein
MSDAPMPDGSLVLQWLFGLAVVAVYAHDRFTHPLSLRATTTFWRYWSAWCGYLVAMLGLFTVLGGGMTAVDPALMLSMLGLAKPPQEALTLPGPLLSALTLTALLPHVPMLKKLDELLKEWFQRVGNIPYEVRELSAHLRGASYAPPAAELDELASVLRVFGVERDWLHGAPDSLRQRWARCVVLYAQVQRWEETRGYTRFVDENKAALLDLRRRVTALAEILDARTLAEFERESDWRLVAHMRRSVGADLAALQRALCDFVSSGVLAGGWSHQRRHAALTQLGFGGLPALRSPLSAHDIVLVMGLVFLAMLFVPLMLRRFFDPTPLGPNVRVIVMVPIIYAIAIVLAVYPKSMLPFARRVPGGGRPVAAYALSGVAAAAAAFVVSLLFRFAFDSKGNVLQALATHGAFVQAWQVTAQRWPWLLMTGLAAVAIAWAADDHLAEQGPPPRWLRAAETVALALVFGALQWMVLQLLTGQGRTFSFETWVRMMITSTLIGALIGWFVPHLFRAPGRGGARLRPALPQPQADAAA